MTPSNLDKRTAHFHWPAPTSVPGQKRLLPVGTPRSRATTHAARALELSRQHGYRRPFEPRASALVRDGVSRRGSDARPTVPLERPRRRSQCPRLDSNQRPSDQKLLPGGQVRPCRANRGG